MFAAAPGKSVRKGEGLVELALRRGIAQSRETGEADARKTEIEWVRGDSADAGIARDILNVRIQVGGGDVIVIVVHAEIVCRPPTPVNPACAGIEPLQTIAAVQ